MMSSSKFLLKGVNDQNGTISFAIYVDTFVSNFKQEWQ